jgi:hypothetical protein
MMKTATLPVKSSSIGEPGNGCEAPAGKQARDVVEFQRA